MKFSLHNSRYNNFQRYFNVNTGIIYILIPSITHTYGCRNEYRIPVWRSYFFFPNQNAYYITWWYSAKHVKVVLMKVDHLNLVYRLLCLKSVMLGNLLDISVFSRLRKEIIINNVVMGLFSYLTAVNRQTLSSIFWVHIFVCYFRMLICLLKLNKKGKYNSDNR